MTILESTPQRLVVKGGTWLGGATLTLDKSEGCARHARYFLMWRHKPVEVGLAEIAEVDLVPLKDAASGAETHLPVVRTRAGDLLSVPVAESEAAETADKLRSFLGLH